MTDYIVSSGQVSSGVFISFFGPDTMTVLSGGVAVTTSCYGSPLTNQGTTIRFSALVANATASSMPAPSQLAVAAARRSRSRK